MFGTSPVVGSIAPVSGEGADGAFGWTAEYVANQRSISERSKVWPSHVVTGSSITSALIGQMN